MKHIFIITIILGISTLFTQGAHSEIDLGQKLSGRILLQVEENGEAWYVDPQKNEKYFLNRPDDAFKIMKNRGTGITNQELDGIPIGLLEYQSNDSDMDGLPDDLEIAIGTDTNSIDTDNDGFHDKVEILNNHNPLSSSSTTTSYEIPKNFLGMIFLQVERNGEAWYINPVDSKRYYLGRPIDAFNIMKKLGLGISNNNLNKIASGYVYKTPPVTQIPTNEPNQDTVLYTSPGKVMTAAAQAIRRGDKKLVLTCFTSNQHKAMEYTMDFLDSEQRLTLANILSDSSSASITDTKAIYSTEVYFKNDKHPVNFYLEKQDNGGWLLTNL